MNSFLLSYKRSQIGYYKFGSGPKTAFCFHGYGEQSSSFFFLGEYAGNLYTFFAIDLPFHGSTRWKEGLDFSKDDLTNIIHLVLEEYGFQKYDHNITLISFSLGGRIALSFFQSQPQEVEKIILLAPDGLKMNFWYWLATQNLAGNKFFALTMKHPGWFFGFLNILNKMKLVNASIYKFVNYHINDPQVRNDLYKRWTSLRKLKPNLSKIKRLVKQHKIQVRLLYGKHDRIILPSRGEKFSKDIEEFCKISVIDSGHQVLHVKNIHDILPALLN